MKQKILEMIDIEGRISRATDAKVIAREQGNAVKEMYNGGKLVALLELQATIEDDQLDLLQDLTGYTAEEIQGWWEYVRRFVYNPGLLDEVTEGVDIIDAVIQAITGGE